VKLDSANIVSVEVQPVEAIPTVSFVSKDTSRATIESSNATETGIDLVVNGVGEGNALIQVKSGNNVVDVLGVFVRSFRTLKLRLIPVVTPTDSSVVSNLSEAALATA